MKQRKGNILFLLATAAMLSAPCGAGAAPVKVKAKAEPMPTWTEWHDLQVNEVNRYRLHSNFFAYANEEEARGGDIEKSSRYLSLEGASGTPTSARKTSTRLTSTTRHGRP